MAENISRFCRGRTQRTTTRTTWATTWTTETRTQRALGKENEGKSKLHSVRVGVRRPRRRVVDAGRLYRGGSRAPRSAATTLRSSLKGWFQQRGPQQCSQGRLWTTGRTQLSTSEDEPNPDRAASALRFETTPLDPFAPAIGKYQARSRAAHSSTAWPRSVLTEYNRKFPFVLYRNRTKRTRV